MMLRFLRMRQPCPWHRVPRGPCSGSQGNVPFRFLFSLRRVRWLAALSSQVRLSSGSWALRARASSARRPASPEAPRGPASSRAGTCRSGAAAGPAQRAFPPRDRVSPSSRCGRSLASSREALLAWATPMASAASCDRIASFLLRRGGPKGE